MKRRRKKYKFSAATTVILLIIMVVLGWCGQNGGFWKSSRRLKSPVSEAVRNISETAKAAADGQKKKTVPASRRKKKTTAERQINVLTGRVVKVADGDTITVLAGKKREKIRLSGIDAPESSQAYGVEARNALAKMVHSREVVVRYEKRDGYQRIVGTVFADGVDINLKMLEAGLAWHYSHFDDTQEYAAAEQQARASRRGLWADDAPVNPYEFRKMRKKGADGSAQ